MNLKLKSLYLCGVIMSTRQIVL